jgi:hypothetical protein
MVVEVAALVSVIVLLMRQNWFGAGDLLPFMIWTSIFAAALATLAVFSIPTQHRLVLPLRVPASIIGGACVALIWSFFITVILGPWPRAFTFPPLICWMAAGSAGLLAAGLLPTSARLSERWIRRRRSAKRILTVVCVLLGAIWLLTPTFSLCVNLGNRCWSIGTGHLAVYVRPNGSPFSVYPVWHSPRSWGFNRPHATPCYNGMVSPPVYLGTVYGLPMWIPFTTLVIPTMLLWLADIRRALPGHCRKCRYNLTGNTSGICPECGTVINESPLPSAP